MINLGNYTFESYAHVINADDTLLKLNPALEKLGYQFMWVDATEIENSFSEIVNVPKADRPRNNIIGRNQHGISQVLFNAILHSQQFPPYFINMEYPGIILLKRLKDFAVTKDNMGFFIEEGEFRDFHSFATDLLLQLRLYKIGEIRYSQFFQITSETRQIGLRNIGTRINSRGDFTLDDNEAEELSQRLVAKFEANALTELAVKNFNIVYDIPDGRIRFITLMTCLESLFNLGKDQISHTIARHVAIILSKDKEEFKVHYARIKKLYNMRNSIVHGGDYKNDIIQDYLELSNKVRAALKYCNIPGLTKQKLFDELNAKGF